MKNIFSQTKDYVKPSKRNVFDLSFHNHGTYNFGTLYPVFCKEVIPGDSFKIDSSFALRFMPTAFPVQTRINANLHFFYVRNRNLWDDWQKFITHTGQTSAFPFLQVAQNPISTGSLSDYLGVPSTFSGDLSKTDLLASSRLFGSNSSADGVSIMTKFTSNTNLPLDPPNFSNSFVILPNSVANSGCPVIYTFSGSSTQPLVNIPTGRFVLRMRLDSIDDIEPNVCFVLQKTFKLDSGYRIPVNVCSFICPLEFHLNSDGTYNVVFNLYNSLVSYDSEGNEVHFNSPFELASWIISLFSDGGLPCFALYQNSTSNHSYLLPYSQPYPTDESNAILLSLTYSHSLDSSVVDLNDVDKSSNPFYSNNPNFIRLNALPYRAYESIYNAFYRNEQNDPLFIDGIPEYNKYVPNTDGGPDSFKYSLHQRNWELDFLTSAVQSPQQGIAPLVGVSSSGDFTFVNKDSNGNIGYFTAKANIGSDGSSITGFQLSDKVVLDGVPSDPASASDVPDNIKRGTVYSLNQMALAGISINDFRNVNALQRWLETNIRRGYKYQDQIKSHFGVDVDYKTLDMPEFIGGVSAPVFSSQVNQTTETETDPLGSYAGQLSLMTNSKHSVKHYCDEHGFILGIFSVTPVPNYSQLLPKHFLKSNYLDYYFPEFGHIGMQPIDYREVCPIQAYSDNPNNLSKTFGYQRPWYDYIASVDEVHGLFRTNLRNFVLNRTFETMPKLNSDFLKVDAEQLNDIFTVQDLEDKIIGQIYFDVTAKRPIPKYGIPRLE